MGIDLTKLNPVDLTPSTIDTMLEVFGLVGQHESRGHGWYRVFIHVPQRSGIPLSLGRAMFKDGAFSHFNWYLNSHGEVGPCDYYMIGLTFYRVTGIVLDGAAWGDLVLRATDAARAEFYSKVVARRMNPKIDRHGNRQSRKKLAPPNPIKHIYRMLSDYVSDATGREFSFLFM